MASSKRNDYLDAGSSDDDESASLHDEQQESRVARAPKRRRIGDGDDERRGREASEDSGGEERAVDSDADVATTRSDARVDASSGHGTTAYSSGSPAADAAAPTDLVTRGAAAASVPTSRITKKRISAAADLNARPSLVPTPSLEPKTGVIYLSRIPPYLTPSALRRLLTPFGAVLRIFLTPEPAAVYSARKRRGGNKKRSFTDGWAEFASKRAAKTCAAALNASTAPAGSMPKGGWYRDDVWNVRYLRGFKWRHLTEQISNEDAERAARVRRGLGEERGEERRFLANVEAARVDEGRERKRLLRARQRAERHEGRPDDVDADASAAAVDVAVGAAARPPRRLFAQSRLAPLAAGAAADGAGSSTAAAEPAPEVRRVLSKIF